MNKRKAWLHVLGIAPRKRKLDKHLIRLGYHDDTEMPPDSVFSLAYEELASFKQVQNATLHWDSVEISDDGTVTWMMFNPQDRKFPIPCVQH